MAAIRVVNAPNSSAASRSDHGILDCHVRERGQAGHAEEEMLRDRCKRAERDRHQSDPDEERPPAAIDAEAGAVDLTGVAALPDRSGEGRRPVRAAREPDGEHHDRGQDPEHEERVAQEADVDLGSLRDGRAEEAGRRRRDRARGRDLHVVRPPLLVDPGDRLGPLTLERRARRPAVRPRHLLSPMPEVAEPGERARWPLSPLSAAARPASARSRSARGCRHSRTRSGHCARDTATGRTGWNAIPRPGTRPGAHRVSRASSSSQVALSAPWCCE